MQALKKFLPQIFLVVAVLGTYSTVYSNEFLYDDEMLIQKNTYLRTWEGIPRAFTSSSTSGSGGSDRFYRPLQGALYTLVFQLAGESEWAFHLLNVLLHIGNTLLLYRLALQLSLTPTGALLAALLWCVHPVHTESISYMSATADPLHTLFLLLGLNVLVPNFAPTYLACAALLYVLGFLSKESAIVFPALVTVIRWWLTPERRWQPRTYFRILPLWVLAGILFVIRATVMKFEDPLNFYDHPDLFSEFPIYRLYTFLATLPQYLRILLWPSDLHMDRGFPAFTSLWLWPVGLGILLIGFALTVLYRQRHSLRPFWALAIFWFIAADVPYMNLLIRVNGLMFDHWLYLPSMGIFMATAETAVHYGKRLAIASLVALSVLLAALTWHYNAIWANPITLYNHILKYEPKVSRVRNNLGMAYSERGDLQSAMDQYQAAIALSDTYPQTQHNLALVLAQTGQIDLAIQHLKRALEIEPKFYPSVLVLVEIMTKLGRTDEAAYYEKMSREMGRTYRR